MNSKTFIHAATLIGGLLSASVLSAATVVAVEAPGDIPVASYSAPAAVKIVNPTGISRRFQGETIRLMLTIDETGQPRNVGLLSGRDPNLVENLLPAVAQWRFTPAKRNGRPVATQVVLPIELVDVPAS